MYQDSGLSPPQVSLNPTVTGDPGWKRIIHTFSFPSLEQGRGKASTLLFPQEGVGEGEVGVLSLIMEQKLGCQVLIGYMTPPPHTQLMRWYRAAVRWAL